ncbi:L-threonylcarbamoyladenylate synthase [Chlorobium phaeobacteroides]|uniref:Threonylcarbamoyl-AMP synthase n=1 Tax=Chlorobium phaeobacteroides (strain DSM 266 / SMG 266 / 2430) TaxID=290317 RepID=A1BDS6_CHLPD|nr:L-threonylcarbamoyladenylate synthase [Chlorobium phaeobacteroides]ABL64553.1 translation factor SUA5 [Chlorobium phaeobacteroides DSM 266]
MQTLLTDSPEEAARIINQGNIVAFPTETVYGLGAAICFPEAVKKLFLAKGRPTDNPLIVHIHNAGEMSKVASEISPEATLLIEHFFPGPLTLVLKKKATVPDAVTAGLDTVGVRCPENQIARAFLRHCCAPVAAPSANLSGKPSSTTWEAVFHDLNGKIPCILRGEPSIVGLESTIVDCSEHEPILLREGAVTLEELQRILPAMKARKTGMKDEKPKSPGLKYPHYAPKAAIRLCRRGERPPESTLSSAYIGLSNPPEGIRMVSICQSIEEYARSLFSFFRACDREGISVIYCELPEQKGLGRAIHDRLMRASGEHESKNGTT